MSDNGLAHVKKLYDARKYGEALVAVDQFLVDHQNNPAALGWKGWCHYQLGEFPAAMVAVASAGEDQWALRCLLFLYAYKKTGFQNKESMLATAERILDKVVIANAYVVFASEPENECFLTHTEVLEQVKQQIAGQAINVAHLLNNTAKWLRVRGLDLSDRLAAIGLFAIALIKYGTGDENAHHRAGAMFWMSKSLEDVGDVHSALGVARNSVAMWETACRIDPQNQGHKSRHQSAVENVTRLEQLIQTAVE